MLRRQLPILKRIYQQSTARTDTNLAKDTKPKWDLLCGVCLERKPSMSRQPREIEVKFAQMLQEIEEENSLKSDHELRLEADLRRAVELKKGKISHEEMSKISGQTALEFEDACRKEVEAFKLAPRVTEADEKNDNKSIERKLAEHLLYVTKEKIGENEVWILPHGPLQGEESLREAAERILREKYGRKVKAKFYGNAPCGFYKYKYPKSVKGDAVGAKIFFMKAQYVAGEVESNESRLDFCWNTVDELSNKMYDPYLKAVRLFVLDDEK
jgi:large subunit ribosomal protein L46